MYHLSPRLHQSEGQTKKPQRDFLTNEASRKISTRIPHRPPFIGFVAQPTNQSPLGFETKPRNRCSDFEPKITKRQLSILRYKSEET
jgi:hypothetical protein